MCVPAGEGSAPQDTHRPWVVYWGIHSLPRLGHFLLQLTEPRKPLPPHLCVNKHDTNTHRDCQGRGGPGQGWKGAQCWTSCPACGCAQARCPLGPLVRFPAVVIKQEAPGLTDHCARRPRLRLKVPPTAGRHDPIQVSIHMRTIARE